MYELILIILVGNACDMQAYYQQEMPRFIVGCSNFGTLEDTMAHWNGFALVSDYNVVYVVDDRKELPKHYNAEHGYEQSISGMAYHTLDYAVAFRYVHVIIHELAHLECECGHGPLHDWHILRLAA